MAMQGRWLGVFLFILTTFMVFGQVPFNPARPPPLRNTTIPPWDRNGGLPPRLQNSTWEDFLRWARNPTYELEGSEEFLEGSEEFPRWVRNSTLEGSEEFLRWVRNSTVEGSEEFLRWVRNSTLEDSEEFLRWLRNSSRETQELVPIWDDTTNGPWDDFSQDSSGGSYPGGMDFSGNNPPPGDPQRRCGYSVAAKAFRSVLVSPGFPSDYPRNANCTWTITGSTSVHLVITNLDIEDESDHCPYDHLTISGQDGQTLPRLCGQIPLRELTLAPPVTLTFVSDESVQLTGFMIQYFSSDTTSQDGVQCGYTVEALFGSLTSPGYPDPYPNNVNCTWEIKAPKGYKMSLTFTHLEVEDDPYCRLDRVLVYAEQNNIVPDALCGESSGASVHSDTNVIRLVLQSDGAGQYPGFSANFYAEPPEGETVGRTTTLLPVAGCGEVNADSTVDIIVSPTFPQPYPAGTNCSWTLRAGRGSVVQLHFFEFDLEDKEAGGQCEKAGLGIWDGQKQLGTFCGLTLPGGSRGIISRTRNVTLTFFSVSNTLPHKGFVVEYSLIERPGTGTGNGGSGTSPPIVMGPSGATGASGASGGGRDNSLFLCANGLTVPLVDTCNTVSECGDGSDEDPGYAGCEALFECTDGMQILASERCDGYRHCSDGSDEGPGAGCTAYFPCNDGTIIPGGYRCDGSLDCADGSDEGIVNGCPGDSCNSGPCKNDGTCMSGPAGTFICTCETGWSGLQCERDIDNGCVGKPCRNGGTCYDQVGGVRCVCAIGFYGERCEEAVSVSTAYKLQVSAENGTDTRTCGESGGPCQSLQLALARAPSGAILELAGSENDVFTVSGAWISRQVVLRASNAAVRVHFEDTVLAGTSTSRPTLSLQGLRVSGELYVGDASLKVVRSVVANLTLRQDYQRRTAEGRVGYNFEDCVLSDSRLLTVDPELLTAELGYRYQASYSVVVSLGGSRLTNTVIDITGTTAEVRLAGTTLAATSGGSGGLTVNTGGSDPPGAVTPPPLPIPVTPVMPVTLNRRRRDVAGVALLQGEGTLGSVGVRHRVRRQVPGSTSTTGSREEPACQVIIRDCTFSNLGQGSGSKAAVLYVTGRQGKFLVEVESSTFLNNSLRAVHVYSNGASQGTVNVKQSQFTGNVAAGPGGAILVEQDTGIVNTRITDSTFTSNLALAYETQNQDPSSQGMASPQLDLTKVSKTTGSGGAVAVSVQASQTSSQIVRAVVDIKQSTFTNNTAENYGGTLYFTGGVSGTVIQCTLTNVDEGGMRPRLGDIIESRGNLRLTNSTVSVVSARDTVAVISYRADKDGSFMESSDLHINCPKGFQTNDVFNAISLGPNATRNPIETLLLFCRSCKKGSYTLDRSGALINGIDVIYTTINTCNSCPYGATCESFVKSKTNFWGAPQADGKVTMYGCPSGYCCQDETCEDYNTCAKNRHGPLCGSCQQGFSESLFSTRCVPNDTCSVWSYIWVLVALYGLGYVLFFLFEDEIKLVVENFADWFRKNIRKCKSYQPDPLEKEAAPKVIVTTEDESDPSDAYLNIFMYYIQAADLLKVDMLYESNRKNPVTEFQDVILELFSFTTFGINPNTCFFRDVTAVMKRLMMTGFIVYLFVVWIVLFCLGGLLKGAHGCRPTRWITSVTLKAKFLGALVNLLLYTYQYFAENSFSVLRCVSLMDSPTPVLFIDGTVTCYQSWQFGVVIFTAVYVGPFFIVLLLAPALLKARQIRVTVFILSILLPLFGSPYLLYAWCRWKRRILQGADNAHNNHQGRGDQEGSVVTITGILTDPYRRNWAGGLCWEGIIALRRLLLVLAATLITNVLFKQVTVTIICLVSLATHIRWVPMGSPSANSLEAMSLGLLVIISISNLVKAVYVDAGNVPREAADTLLLVWDWIEAALLSILPMAVLGLVCLAVVARVLSFIFKRIRLACCPGPQHAQDDQDVDRFTPRFRQSRRKSRKKITDIQKTWNNNGQNFDNYGFEPGYPSSRNFARNWEELSQESYGADPENGPPSVRPAPAQADPGPMETGWPGGRKAGFIHTRPTYQRGEEFYDPLQQPVGENGLSETMTGTVDRKARSQNSAHL